MPASAPPRRPMPTPPQPGPDQVEVWLLVSLLCTLALLYAFHAFHAVVSRHLTPALDVLRRRLRLHAGDDAGGAAVMTAMAVGVCAPPLFVSAVAAAAGVGVGVSAVVGALVRSAGTAGVLPPAHYPPKSSVHRTTDIQ